MNQQAGKHIQEYSVLNDWNSFYANSMPVVKNGHKSIVTEAAVKVIAIDGGDGVHLEIKRRQRKQKGRCPSSKSELRKKEGGKISVFIWKSV